MTLIDLIVVLDLVFAIYGSFPFTPVRVVDFVILIPVTVPHRLTIYVGQPLTLIPVVTIGYLPLTLPLRTTL